MPNASRLPLDIHCIPLCWFSRRDVRIFPMIKPWFEIQVIMNQCMAWHRVRKIILLHLSPICGTASKLKVFSFHKNKVSWPSDRPVSNQPPSWCLGTWSFIPLQSLLPFDQAVFLWGIISYVSWKETRRPRGRLDNVRMLDMPTSS